TLLTESTRRVGTAWPGAASRAECGDGKAPRKFRAFDSVRRRVAPHNSLNLLESQPERARFNASSRPAVVSSRQEEPKVEFVNHPRSVFASVSSGWAFRRAGDGGWGAPDTARNQRAAHILMRGTGALER